MRKLSELYELVQKECEDSEYELGICSEIKWINASDKEIAALEDHFQNGDHKIKKENRTEGYWFLYPHQRESYLKYLIDLCKSQEAKEQS